MINSIKNNYERHFLGWDLIISMILVIIVYFVCKELIGCEIIVESFKTIRAAMYGTIAAVAGALLGFVITGLSVLLTTGTNDNLNALKRSKHYKQIFDVFFSSSKYLGLLVLISMLSLIFDKDDSPSLVANFITMWGIIIVIFRVARCIWVLENIVKLNIRNS